MEHEDDIRTTIRVPRRIWIALRALAEAAERPGRPTVNAVVVDLVEAELARKAKGSDRA